MAVARIVQGNRALQQRSASTGSFFNGVFPIMATPFNPDETLDLGGFTTALRFMADAGADGATIIGVLGESNRLVDNERAALITAAIEVKADFEQSTGKGFPICVGTSHPGTYATGELTKMAQELGADAVMVTPSKEPVPATPATLLRYFGAVAEAAPGFPIVLQDHPASTQVHMSMDLVHDITASIPEVASVKAEALPTPAKVALLRKMWGEKPPANPDCTILVGLGALYGGFDLEAGADGFMTGFAFPEVLKAMVDANNAGNAELRDAIYHKYLPLIVFEQQPGLAVRKQIYQIRGLMASGHVRHPGANITPFAAEMTKAVVDAAFPGQDVTKRICA